MTQVTRDGNVIYPDFRGREITIPISAEILFADELIVVMRVQVGDVVTHFVADACA